MLAIINRIRIPSLIFFLACCLSTTYASEKSTPATILVVGDSLSSAYGFPLEQGWVNLLRNKLAAEKKDYSVINASISGDTSKGALSRLPALLAKHQPKIVIIEIGGNDGLRGQSIKAMQNNIASMIEQSLQIGSKVLLLGIRIPPNYGSRYTDMFVASYAKLAKEYNISLVPVFLQGIDENSDLMQDDGIHPHAKAQPMLLNNVWAVLNTLL